MRELAIGGALVESTGMKKYSLINDKQNSFTTSQYQTNECQKYITEFITQYKIHLYYEFIIYKITISW